MAARVWQRRNFFNPGILAEDDDEEELSSIISSSSPFAVIEVMIVDDVQIALPIVVGLARDYKLDFRIRSGGHSYMSGYSTIRNGIMLNLVKLNTISTINNRTTKTNISDVGTTTTSNDYLLQKNQYQQHEGNDHEQIKDNPTTSRSQNLFNITAIDKNSKNVNIISNSASTIITTVLIGPGVNVEDFMKTVLDEYGYSSIVASAGGVGMGGFILGGGYGLQSRMYGLAIDNVVSLNVTLPSGESKENVRDGNDLFWALLGSGGGNIGVVTSFEYRVYPSLDIKLAATVKVPLSEMTQFLQRLADNEPNLTPEFTLKVEGYIKNENRTSQGLFQYLTSSAYYGEQKDSDGIEGSGKQEKEQHHDGDKAGDDNDGLVTISMLWMGDSNPKNPIGMQYIKNNVIPLFSNNSTIDNVVYYYFSWSGMSRIREQDDSWKSVWSAQSWNGFLLPQNNNKEVWTDIQSSLSAMFRYCNFVSPKIELWGGVISNIPSNATLFSHRDAVYNIGIELFVPTKNDIDAANDEMHLVNAIWPSIAQHLHGVYVNYPMASLSNESYPTAYWGKNLKRLKELKQRYDPTHALNISQSIPIFKKEVDRE